MKNKLLILFFLLFLILNIIPEEVTFGNYDTYINSCTTDKKWDKLIQNSYKMIDKQKYDKAINFFNKSVQKGCKCKQINRDIIICYVELKNYDNATKLLDSINDKDFSKRIFLVIGNKYFEKEEYEKALNYYIKAEMSKDAFYEIYKRIGDIYFKKNYFENAINYYENANISDEEYKKIHMEAGDYYFSNKEYNKANRYYKKIKLLKEDYIKIADNYFNIGKYDTASIYYKRADSKKGEEKVSNKLKKIYAEKLEKAIKKGFSDEFLNEIVLIYLEKYHTTYADYFEYPICLEDGTRLCKLYESFKIPVLGISLCGKKMKIEIDNSLVDENLIDVTYSSSFMDTIICTYKLHNNKLFIIGMQVGILKNVENWTFNYVHWVESCNVYPRSGYLDVDLFKTLK